MRHGEREVNCGGEGERGRERKKRLEENLIPVGGWMPCSPEAFKTDQVHLTPPPPPGDGAPPQRQSRPPWGSMLWGEMEKCPSSPTALQGEIKSRESFPGHL